MLIVFYRNFIKRTMEISQQAVNPQQICTLCLNIGKSRCGRCHNVFYCSRQHQVQDWPVHSKVCRKEQPQTVHSPVVLNPTNATNIQMDNFASYLGDAWCQNNLPCTKPEDLNVIQPTNIFDTGATCNIAQEKPANFPLSIEDELFSSLSSEFLSSDNNLWDLINSCEAAQSLFDDGTFLEKEAELSNLPETPQPESASEQSGNQILGKKVLNLMGGASLHAICTNVVYDLNKYGICVLDKFVGPKLGNLILGEVKNLYNKGIFKKGELVIPNPYLAKESIRSDVTTWVNGTEPECLYIGHLMQVLDVVMTTCNKFQDNGTLSKYKLHRRTKAMIACYPGDGTHYKKHIDNPHKDGRCVTCIYYLNQDWNTEKDGGMLRMFPSVMEDDVAQIEPIFDRMLFFWSDKRNPHEVLKAFKTRFAITVWYFDADERDRALLKSKDRTQMSSV